MKTSPLLCALLGAGLALSLPAPALRAADAPVDAPAPSQPAAVTPPDDSQQVADLKAQLADTQARLDAALRTYTLQKDQAEQTTQADAQKAQTATADHDALTAQLQDATTKLAATQTQVADLTQQLAAQTSAATQASGQAAQQVATAQSAAATAAAELAAARDQLRQTRNQSASYAAENARLRTQLALAGSGPGAPSAAASGVLAPTPVAVAAPPPPAVTQAPTPAPLPAAANNPSAPHTYTVVAGDSLTRISKKVYGTPDRWNDLFQANRAVLKNANSLRPGMTLTVP